MFSKKLFIFRSVYLLLTQIFSISLSKNTLSVTNSFEKYSLLQQYSLLQHNLPMLLFHNFSRKSMKIIFQWSDIAFSSDSRNLVKKAVLKVLWKSCFGVLRKFPIKLSWSSSYFEQIAHLSLVKFEEEWTHALNTCPSNFTQLILSCKTCLNLFNWSS